MGAKVNLLHIGLRAKFQLWIEHVAFVFFSGTEVLKDEGKHLPKK